MTSKERLHIIFDLSLQGRSNYLNNQAGINRVAENILNGLLSHPDCTLSFCSSTFRDLCITHKYYEANPILKSRPFLHSRETIKHANRFQEIEDQVKKSTWFLEKLSLKLYRKILKHKAHKLKLDAGLISLIESNRNLIYLSIYDALPDFVSQISSIQKFLIVHDLIAIHSPYLFGTNATNTIRDLTHNIDSLKENDWAICVSESTKSDLLNYHKTINPNHVKVIPLAASELFRPIDDASYLNAIKLKYNIPDGKYILSLSTLEPRKNINHIIRSFIRLVKEERLKDLNLVLVGANGWSYESIYQELESHREYLSQIILTGFVPDEDLAALYSGAMAFTYMSFYEGFGLPPLEAMQCGLPVIVSNNSSLLEVVGNAGILLEAKDEDALCESILKLYRDQELSEEYRMKSIIQAKKFSWKKATDQLVQIFRESLAG